ncbi:MAG TPA: cupin domain-containing protein [Acidimicrobiia bacterium]|nr:cupin domain-containing protein [Acidimicrobiia bacterium]
MASITPGDSVEWSTASGEHFTGKVEMASFSEPADDDGVLVLAVRFSPGARTDWHSHPGGQVLHVVTGRGLVANRDGQRLEVAAGDTVTTPPGEMHWHGAGPEESMMHLSITSHGKTEWSDEKVTDYP